MRSSSGEGGVDGREAGSGPVGPGSGIGPTTNLSRPGASSPRRSFIVSSSWDSSWAQALELTWTTRVPSRATRAGQAFRAIAEDSSLREILLSGGDPLMLTDERLGVLWSRLEEIEHLKRIRIHTRLPIVLPDRITEALLNRLQSSRLTPIVVVHANHPRELSPRARDACARIVDAGIPMLSQSVLLRGVNDDAETLGALMRAFVETRIKPYYLHQGDLAPGTAHLRADIDEGQALMRALHGRLSGLCQPTYVLDIPGGHGKSPIGPGYLDDPEPGGDRLITDYRGHRHRYPE